MKKYLAIALILTCTACPTQAGMIYATGQLLIPAVPGVHDDIRENRIYAIDTATGIATPLSPLVAGTPPGLAGTPDGRLLGFNNGQLGEVNPFTAAFTPIGGPAAVDATGLDVLADGRAFVVPFTGPRQLHRIDPVTGTAIPVGSPNAIGSAIDTAFGLAPGTSQPFIIGLGSVGDTIYGVNLEAGRTNLIALNPDTGVAAVIGAPDAVAVSGYSGFAALTGVDEDGDGRFDALFGNVNFFNGERLGGVARYDLESGAWTLVGSNPGVIFFGFGSAPVAVPEPASLTLLSLGGLALVLHRLRWWGNQPRTNN